MLDIILYIRLFTAPATITEAPADKAQRCNTEECQLPYCFCSKDGTQIPGGLEADKVNNTTTTTIKHYIYIYIYLPLFIFSIYLFK